MNKKILIGSIIAITILIGVSFTSVVGYNSIETDVKASPLFNIRTSRAINEESEDFSCEYVGKGKEINLLIPKIYNKTALIQEFMDKISKMDDETHDRFIGLVISYINQNNFDEDEIVNLLKKLKDNEENDNIIDWSWNERRECTMAPCTIDAWFTGCYLYHFLWLFVYLPYLIIKKYLCIRSFDCNTWI